MSNKQEIKRQRHIDEMMTICKRCALRSCPATLQAPRTTKYQSITFNKGCDIHLTLLPDHRTGPRVSQYADESEEGASSVPFKKEW
jgi:hypothetical protein